ncbi:hypothetical protein CKO18_11710 [Rhodoferax fermentans]|uniref:Uncharacterized protein n=2 Tax=Rhodoferax fermentans TaxID=28066 RepID=A0A1T1ASK1_RHOFE|nr:hypothetical protein [Rhodoferax fermentans]OOV07092.1 hypothetical protein RF819_10450 [Rhodoferax fermentans]
MFKAKNLGIGIPAGWMSVFAQLCENIDEILGPDKRGFHFVQCKQKFGSARWYCKLNKVKQRTPVDILDSKGVVMSLRVPDKHKTPDMLGEKIAALVHEAEARTMQLCIVCGEPSRLDTFDGYMLQLCAVHKKMRRKGTLPNFWEEDDEFDPP